MKSWKLKLKIKGDKNSGGWVGINKIIRNEKENWHTMRCSGGPKHRPFFALVYTRVLRAKVVYTNNLCPKVVYTNKQTATLVYTNKQAAKVVYTKTNLYIQIISV